MHPLLPRLELHGKEKDPDGGPFPAYPSGKTWDEPSGKTGSGKKFFHNIIDGSKVRRFTGHRLKAVKNLRLLLKREYNVMAINKPFFHIPPKNSCMFSATKGG